jgi:CO dehydrogenase/acetyl-CoA synthase epsilon subunit
MFIHDERIKPIIGCKIESKSTIIDIHSNYTNYDGLDGSIHNYKREKSDNVIFVGCINRVTDRGVSVGISVSEAEEIIQTLQSMVKIIKENA